MGRDRRQYGDDLARHTTPIYNSSSITPRCYWLHDGDVISLLKIPSYSFRPILHSYSLVEEELVAIVIFIYQFVWVNNRANEVPSMTVAHHA